MLANNEGDRCEGICAIRWMVKQLGLAKRIDEAVKLRKLRHPYHESDHVFSIACNVVCGGRVLERRDSSQ